MPIENDFLGKFSVKDIVLPHSFYNSVVEFMSLLFHHVAVSKRLH